MSNQSNLPGDSGRSQLGAVAPYNLATMSADSDTAWKVVHALTKAGIPAGRLTFVASPEVDVPDLVVAFPADYVRLGDHRELLVFGEVAHRVPIAEIFQLLGGVDDATEVDLVAAVQRGAVIVVAHCEDGIEAREAIAPALDAGAALIALSDGEGHLLTAPMSTS